MRELRQRASSVLKRVMAGETIEVTDHGHPIARIVPLQAGVLDQLVVEGRATPPSGDLISLLDELSLPTSSAGTELPSAALAQLRDAER